MHTARNIAALALLALGACSQNDDEITRRVQDRLASSAVSDQVKVSTERRIVHLEGVVQDTNELNRAEMAARDIPGVLGVDNRLVIQNPVNTTGATATPPSPSPAGPKPPPGTPSNPAAP